MGLEQVIEEILAEGEAEAEAVVAEAEQEAEAIVSEAKEKAEDKRETIAKETEARARTERRRIMASAEVDAKKKRLEAEADVLASIRSRVESKVVKLPEDEREQMLRDLVEASGADAFGDGAKAWGRKEDREVIENLGFSFEGETDCLGGALIESPDGSIREDLRFDAVLDEVWRDEVHAIASDVLER